MRCTYCGDPYGDTLDHVVPHSYSGITTKKNYSRDHVVPACRECNTLLGAKMFTTVGTRAAYLAGALGLRYAKALRMPYWSDDEIASLGPGVRGGIETMVSVARETRDRIEHCEQVAAISPSISEVWDEVDDMLCTPA